MQLVCTKVQSAGLQRIFDPNSQGTLELKAFLALEFNKAETVKVLQPHQYVDKKLVDQEDPNSPISDDLIVNSLAEDGISIPGTVANTEK